MRNGSHATLIQAVRHAVEVWRKRERWSIATVVQEIVEVHERLGLDVVTEITFESDRDALRRMQTNGERVYRWLDDVSKPNNHLPANFLPSILAALPMDLRIECVDQFLLPAGLSVRALEGGGPGCDIPSLLQGLAKEGGEATAAMAALVDGADRNELSYAQRQLTESAAATQEALAVVEAMLQRGDA